MMLILVTLLCGLPLVKACLQCDPTIERLHKGILMSSTVKLDVLKHDFRWFRQECGNRRDFIDPTTFYRAKTEYKTEIYRLQTMALKGSIDKNVRSLVMKGVDILSKHLAILSSEGLCPNECGILPRRLLKCSSCRQEIRTCSSPTLDIFCGVFPVHAEEGEQRVFNCFRSWHHLIAEKIEYHFSIASVVPGTREVVESDFVLFFMTSDSYLVLNHLQTSQQGTIRCTLQGQSGTVFYRVHFQLTVSALPPKTPRPMITLPPLPPEYGIPVHVYKILFLTFLATITALSLVASVGFTVILRLIMKRRRAAIELRQKREEENE